MSAKKVKPTKSEISCSSFIKSIPNNIPLDVFINTDSSCCAYRRADSSRTSRKIKKCPLTTLYYLHIYNGSIEKNYHICCAEHLNDTLSKLNTTISKLHISYPNSSYFDGDISEDLEVIEFAVKKPWDAIEITIGNLKICGFLLGSNIKCNNLTVNFRARETLFGSFLKMIFALLHEGNIEECCVLEDLNDLDMKELSKELSGSLNKDIPLPTSNDLFKVYLSTRHIRIFESDDDQTILFETEYSFDGM